MEAVGAVDVGVGALVVEVEVGEVEEDAVASPLSSVDWRNSTRISDWWRRRRSS